MCTDTKSNLDSLEDFIFNQDKIVTYRWLSKKLNIHTNTSKQLLYTFAKNRSNEAVSVNYLVSGSTEEGDVKVLVVPESQVDKVKGLMDSVLSLHVYSVQKASSNSTTSDLYLADSTAPISSNKSSIALRQVEKREFKVVVPEKSLPPAKQPTTSTSKPQNKTEAATKPSLFASKAAEKRDKGQSLVEPAKNKPAVGINKSPVKTKPLSPIKKKGAQAKSGNIGAFFSKQAEKKTNQPPPSKAHTQQNKPAQQDVGHTVMEVDEDIPADILENKSTEKPVHKTPVVKKKQPKAGIKKRKAKEEENTPARKRKRIVLASDSESEEDQEEEDVYVEEEPEAPEPQPLKVLSDSEEEEVIPPTPCAGETKRKVRKEVDKVYEDDEGFIVTKKEYIYVSCSDDEETDQNKTEPSPKPTVDKPKPESAEINDSEHHKQDDSKSKKGKSKPNKKTTKIKAKSPLKKSPPAKQASIMSFFQKK